MEYTSPSNYINMMNSFGFVFGAHKLARIFGCDRNSLMLGMFFCMNVDCRKTLIKFHRFLFNRISVRSFFAGMDKYEEMRGGKIQFDS